MARVGARGQGTVGCSACTTIEGGCTIREVRVQDDREHYFIFLSLLSREVTVVSVSVFIF